VGGNRSKKEAGLTNVEGSGNKPTGAGKALRKKTKEKLGGELATLAREKTELKGGGQRKSSGASSSREK